ncbi:MAG: hypothetical protein ACRDJE_00895 [Dehalococcoidia bacterium]
MPDATMLSAIGTLAAAIAAGFSAYAAIRIARATNTYTAFTKKTWEELRRQNERTEQPNVQVLLRPARPESTLFELVVRNQGTVPVYDVTITPAPANVAGIGRDMLKDYPLFGQPIRVMPEGQEITGVLFNSRAVISTLPANGTITFTVDYMTADDRPHQQTYEYNLAIYEGLLDVLAGTLPATTPSRWSDQLPPRHGGSPS